MKKTFLNKDENLFSYVVDTFRSSASISMGKMKNPVTNKTNVNIQQAKYYLDLLIMLQKKTKNILESMHTNEKALLIFVLFQFLDLKNKKDLNSYELLKTI